MQPARTITCAFLLFLSCNKELQNVPKDIPPCIKDKIEFFIKLPVDSRPYSLTEYLYKGENVYYISSACCDQYNPVYNSSCVYLGAPDGGFTGKGDGKLTDFKTTATKTRLIWGK